jgi:hypothetical protein
MTLKTGQSSANEGRINNPPKGEDLESDGPMSRHVPRRERWSKHGPNEYRTGSAAVRFEKGSWWALLTYRELPLDVSPLELDAWRERFDRLGPFKRPRNAMIAAEDRLVLLKRRLGDRVALESPLLP